MGEFGAMPVVDGGKVRGRGPSVTGGGGIPDRARAWARAASHWTRSMGKGMKSSCKGEVKPIRLRAESLSLNMYPGGPCRGSSGPEAGQGSHKPHSLYSQCTISTMEMEGGIYSTASWVYGRVYPSSMWVRYIRVSQQSRTVKWT